MAPRELEDNAYAKRWRENKEYHGIFEKGIDKENSQQLLWE